MAIGRLRKFKFKKGMTFLEIIVTMLIIGIISAVIIPHLDWGISPKAAVEGATFMIAADIRYVQEAAMATGANKSIIFTAGSNSYSFQPTHHLDPSGQLPVGVRIGNSLTITFNSFGEPIGGGGQSLVVTGNGQSRSITISPYTGKVSIS